MKDRILRWLISLDQFCFCTLTLGGSMPDETASAAAWRGEQLGHILPRFFRPVIDKLFWFDPEHCRKAYLAEVSREQSPS